MKSFLRNAICILMTLMLFVSVLGSRGMSISAEAEEFNNELDLVFFEDSDDVVIFDEEEEPLEEAFEEADEEFLEEALEEADEESLKETFEEAADISDEMMLDVCFFIRGNGIGADIPHEPGLYFSDEYSSAIRVDNAIAFSEFRLSTEETDGYEESLLDDGFTASNEVSQMFALLPEAADISDVVSDFDESRHYVVWYVVKTAITDYPNSDVFIHVDGVIRERADIDDPEEEPLTEEPEEIVDPIPDVTLEIRALFLEDGVECKEIEFDGREHTVGGFEIIVKDKWSGNPIIGYIYECYGIFLGTKVYADSGLGTEFIYQGENFWVNVVKAFAKVTNPGDSQEVVFYDADDNPLRTPADFIIKDSAGNTLPAKFNVVPNTGTVKVKARDITVEAGTTVKNNTGQTLTDGSFTITSGSLLDGHRIEKVVINGSQTGVGRSVNEIASVSIVDEYGNSVNHLYNINKVNGELVLVDSGTGEMLIINDTDTAAVTDADKGSNTDPALDPESEPEVSSEEEGEVLGARRGDTSDHAGADFGIIFLTLCFACGLVVIKNGKRTY